MSGWRRFAATPGARAGLGALIIFLLVGAGADLIASDRPLVAIGGWTLRAPIPYGPDEQHPGGVSSVLAPPSRAHWLGTDDRGRDVAARLVHGARVALLVGPLAVALYVVFGLLVGVAAALGRRVDFVVGRVVEVGLMFPTLLLLLAIQGVTSATSLAEVALAIAVTQWPYVARLTRAEALRFAVAPHVEAARAVGAGPLRILGVHILPLAATPALTAAAFGIGQAVLFETALTFLGFGVPPPTASWGELLAQAQASGLAPWLLIPPTVAVAAVVLACNLVGDGVRNALSSTAGTA